MRKIFTFLLALAASVGMMNAKVTWNSSNIFDLKVRSYQPYSMEGVTLSANSDMVEARWQDFGDESMDGISFNANETGGYTFSNTLGKNFTKIQMTLNSPSSWNYANLGSGWSFSWEPIENKPATVTWTGNASTVDLLKEASDFGGEQVRSIVFYFEGDSEAPDPTYTVALKDGTVNADKVTLSKTSAVEGATVTVTPNEEYEITDFSATYNTTEKLSTSFDPATGAYSFKMPAYDVTIEATIALKPVPEGDIFAGFTATAGAGGFNNEGHANLVDNKFTSADWTKWCADNSYKSVPTGETGDACWWIDFEASAALNLTGYILTTGNDTGNEHGRNPKNWLLKAKLNADDAWTTIATVTDDVTMKNQSFKDYKFFVDQSGPYQYFRFEMFANQGANVMQLCELRLIGTEAPDPAKVAVTGVTLDQNEAQMTVGGVTLTLTATVAPDDATDKTVVWTSSDPSVATVANGVVIAVAAGSATITATATNGTPDDTTDDFSATCDVTVSDSSDEGSGSTGALPGKFSVSASQVVYFSRGNLQASTTDLGANWTWAFAKNQYNCVAANASNTAISGDGTVSTNGTVDLFGWSTAATQYGIHVKPFNSTYSGDFVDWGSNPALTAALGEDWRTLTSDEWTYLLDTRTTTSGVRYAKAEITDKTYRGTPTTIKGLIILPDDWSTDYHALASTNTADAAFTSNQITSTVWKNELEAHGAVFMPAAGYRLATSVYSYGDIGYYWSATPNVADNAYDLFFMGDNIYPAYNGRRFDGHSVRLVTETAPAPASVSPVTAARFLYNYDCQRNPAYPKQGTPCTLRGFSNPYVGYNGIGSDVKNTPFGPWKLEFVANYTPSNDYGCQRVVSQAVNQYYSSLSNQEKEAKRLEVPIFRLWQYNIVAGEYQHASYGIVCAYADEGNAEDHGALFISSEGNGCFLAGKPHDAQISLSCENDLTTGLNNLITAASATDPNYDAYMPVILSIDAIGTVELTQHCKDFIEGSSSAYNALTDAQKEQVTNYQVLEDAKNQWAPLVAEAKPYADAVVDLINAIPNPIVYTQSCKNKIDAAQKAYDALTSGQKIFVSNYETLKNAPFDLIKAAPYAHILFKANGKEKKVENVTLPREFTEAEMKTMLKEMYSVEGDYDMYANSYSDAVNISGGKWTIYPFMGNVNINGDLSKYDQEGHDMIPISLEITLELPPYEPEPLADCELAWKDVPEGGVVGTIGHEDEVKLPYFTASLDFMLALDKGTATLRLGSTDESVLAVHGINDFEVNGVGECDVYIVHDEDAVFAYDSAAFHVTVNPEPTPVGNLKLIEFQVPASWENDNTPISIADFPDFVATTYEIASALPVTSEPSLVVFGFSGDDETSVYTKVDGQVSKPSTGTIVRKAFFENTQAHYYYPVLAGEPEPTVYNSGSVALSNLKVGDILMAGVTLTDDSDSKVKFVPSRLKLMGNIRKSELTVANFVSSLQTPLLGENAAMTFQGGAITITPIDEEGKDGNAWVVTEIYVEADIPVTLAGITYSGTEPQPTPTTTVTWNSTDFTEEGTYTSHKGIEVNPGVEVIDIAMEVPDVTISGPGSFSTTNSNLVFTKIEVSGGEYDELSFEGEGWSDSEGKRVWEGQAATVPFNLGTIYTGDEGNIPWTIVFTLAPAAPQPQPTAVENVQTNQVQGTKILRDGQLYIMYKGTMYNVQGARVK